MFEGSLAETETGESNHKEASRTKKVEAAIPPNWEICCGG